MTTWTPDMIGDLKRLWQEGLSCSQIARAIGCGVTRNGVSGKIHRMGVAQRSVDVISRQQWMRSQPRSPSPPRLPKVAVVREAPANQPEPKGAPGVSLGRGLCQYIHGEICPDQQWRMCGHDTGGIAESWCPACRQVVFDKARTAKAQKSAAQISAERTMRRIGLG